MESQILYESLTKPRCDLDKNMNKNEKTQGSVGTVNIEHSAVETILTAQHDVVGNEMQTTPSDVPGVKNEIKSKLLKQLQSPLKISMENRDFIKTQVFSENGHTDNISNNLSRNGDKPGTKDVSSSRQSNENLNYSNKTESTTAQSFIPVHSLNSVVSTSETKSDSLSIASPSSSVSSGRSKSTSPIPSPETGSVPSHEVSSSKLVEDESSSQKRRRRGSAWTDAETEYLMEVWARQADIIRQKGGDESVTCAPVYRLISRSMAEQGWEKTWEQCKTRIHTLKRAYKITKDEIDEGCQTITYCRHFDKLEIICGDNKQVSPGMLAITLEQKRRQRQVDGKGKREPVRRKLTVGENPNLVKKVKTCDNLPNGFGHSRFQGQNSVASAQSIPSVQSTQSTNTMCFPPLQSQFQLQPQPPPFQQLQQQSLPATLNQNLPNAQQSVQGSVLPTVLQYPTQVTTASGINGTQSATYSSDVGTPDSQICVEREHQDTETKLQNSAKEHREPVTQWNVLSSQTCPQNINSNTPKVSTGNDIERMKLDLEMRRLEVERNKIESEERQRREDRDHQYRMMQLLLFGLGQQNISQVLSGQGSDVAHAHDTVLSRALENGLVPGGPQKANEKGLSFNEL